ncbi:MAG: hypothetical protein HYU36_10940 [Planctomycetes bacterium]|nr:hypothetical protein [Planctomycetota bacterium]
MLLHWPKEIVALCAFIAVAGLALQPVLDSAMLRGPAVEVVVFCDTSVLDPTDLKAFALYDRAALSPLARALGLFQNRSPGEARSYLVHPLPDLDQNAYSITLKSVPPGPICRVLFVSAGKRFYAEVTDRGPKDGRIYVHVAGCNVSAPRPLRGHPAGDRRAPFRPLLGCGLCPP